MSREKQDRCMGIYLGKVVQHLTHGLLKVYIYGIYPEEYEKKPELLPVCTQMAPQFGGSNNGNGTFSYPNIGATVVCCFANGDQNLPLMLGTVLGGQNAFGQYEWIKGATEEKSDRHLVTAGKSHIQMCEDGRLSVVVFDPIRTDAETEYENSPNAELSVNNVKSRKICDQIAENKLSNIDCQIVLDNSENYGMISASTHYYNPIKDNVNVANSTLLNGAPINFQIMATKNGEEKHDTKIIADNSGNYQYSNLSSIDLFSQSNDIFQGAVNMAKKCVMPTHMSVEVYHSNGLDGDNDFKMLCTVNNQFNSVTKSEEGNILSTNILKHEYAGRIRQKIPAQFEISNNAKENITDTYVNQQTGQTKIFKGKNEDQVTISGSKENGIDILSYNNEKIQAEKDSITLLEEHTKNLKAESKINTNCQDGITASAIYNKKEIETIAGVTTSEKINNTAKFSLNINPDTKCIISLEDKQTKNLNNSRVKNDVACQLELLASDGEINLHIIDNLKKQECFLAFTGDGIATLSSSAELHIKAPAISIKGKTMTQEFKEMTVTADKLNIKASSGDCKIQNVSLLNHVHIETQSGDVVASQPTKPAKASN